MPVNDPSHSAKRKKKNPSDIIRKVPQVLQIIINSLIR